MSNQEVETPVEFLKAVEKLLGIFFTYDMAANLENSKCPLYKSKADDSLSCDWPLDGWCWLNPPFTNLGKWIAKCHKEMRRGCKIVSVWPLSSDQNTIYAWNSASIWIIHGRIWPNVRSCMLCVWQDNTRPFIQGLEWNSKFGTMKRVW